MTDQKVTDLTAATTPLSGGEVLYVVQGGADRQVSAQDVANLGGGASWGAITGTLSSQTDLQSALDAKLNASKITVGTTAPGSPAVNDLWVDTN